MKCEKCNENDAKINFTEVKHNGKKKLHLCESCAQKHHTYIDSPTLKYTTKDFTGNLLQLLTSKSQQEYSDEKCDLCEITYQTFKKTGRFGCPNDYKVFRNNIKKLIESIHGNNKHCGKVPHSLQTEKKIAKLKSKLEVLINNENYEEAAVVRDEIIKIEKDYNDFK